MPNPESLNTQLANAVGEVARAQDRLQRMVHAAQVAFNEETAARNAVNEAQKHFDTLVAEVKKSALHDTTWRQPRLKPDGQPT